LTATTQTCISPPPRGKAIICILKLRTKFRGAIYLVAKKITPAPNIVKVPDIWTRGTVEAEKERLTRTMDGAVPEPAEVGQPRS